MKKHNGRKRESIAETLAAVIVAVLGGMMVAGAMASSMKSMDKTDAMMRSYYERITGLADGSSADDEEEKAQLKASDGRLFTSFSKDAPVIVYTENNQDPSLSYYLDGADQ